MVRGLLGLLGPSALRLAITVNSQENESATILNQNMVENLAPVFLLFSRIVWRKNAQVNLMGFWQKEIVQKIDSNIIAIRHSKQKIAIMIRCQL